MGADSTGGLPAELETQVYAILDGDDARRDSALAALCRAHPGHARTIARWLAEVGVTVPAEALPTEGAAFPRALGDYLLVAVIGRGGFGTVYRAEQQRPLRRSVAVKVLNPGMDSRDVLARFAGERAALQRMDHPGIARLLDAGATPEGRPFFVMELVEGPPLLRLCRERQLPIHERIDLFLAVLDAVQHAHQKAVVHRDLSANNVLVATVDGRLLPKIIDFGIAKSLADPLLVGGAMTMRGTLMGTPEYMSPEQAAGQVEAIDTRTDVYSLGVQLYELLCGELPIPSVVLRAQGLAGMAEQIATHPVPPASERAAPEVQKLLRGDLDAILGKAIAKAPDDRYATVAEFAADLRRYRNHEPVAVAQPTLLARLVKFVRRNRAISVAIAVAAAALILATIVLTVSLQMTQAALASVERQKGELGRKADEGFRLLANEERLREANAAADLLPPPWPQHRDAYQAWERRHADPLRRELDKTRESRRLVEARRLPTSPPFADPADQHLATALLRLERNLEAFFADGTAARIGRLRERQSQIADSTARFADAWQSTRQALRVSDGKVAARAYAGLKLEPIAGLAPLGIDPTTRLAEFLDLASHAPDAPLPARRDDGALALPDGCGIVFVLLPAGSVRLGAYRGEPGLPQNDPDASDAELGGESVRLQPFLVARTELTIAQWRHLQGLGAAPGARADLPATGIDWQQAHDVLQRFDMALPTEAQWEYACRAGSPTPWHWGADAGPATDFAVLQLPVQPVGSRRANRFGLHDVHGNVAEWCRDAWHRYGALALRDGDGRRGEPRGDEPRVVRGGAAGQPLVAMRSAARLALPPGTARDDLGVRPVRRLP